METTRASTRKVEKVLAMAFRHNEETYLQLAEKHVVHCPECNRRIEITSLSQHTRKHHGLD